MAPEVIYGKIQELASISAWLRQTGHIKRFPTEPTETDHALAIHFLEYLFPFGISLARAHVRRPIGGDIYMSLPLEREKGT